MKCYWEIEDMVPTGMVKVPSKEVGAKPLEMLYAIIDEVGEEVENVEFYRSSSGGYYAFIDGPGGETIMVRKCIGSNVPLFVGLGVVTAASGAGIGYALDKPGAVAIGGVAGLMTGLLSAYYYARVQTGGLGMLSGCTPKRVRIGG